MNVKQEYGLPQSMYGKTFAEASKHLEKMFKNRNSQIDLRTKKEFMSRLKDVQEEERKKLEGIYGNQEQGQQQFDDGGFGSDSYMPSDIDTINQNNEVASPYSGGTSWVNRNLGQNSWFGKNSDSIYGGLGLAASALGPMIANRQAMKSLKMPETLRSNLINENQYSANLVNRQQLLRNQDEQAASQRYFIGQTGGNYSQQSAMLANLNANRMYGTGNLMLQADMADAQEKARIQGLRAGIQQFNVQQQDRTAEINAQNQASYYSTLAAYRQAQGANIGAIGQSLFNMMQARKYGKEMGNVYGMSAINNQQQQRDSNRG
jgi:hypothetical protein